MASRQLSPDIVSLIHHVELNRSGWWKKGVFTGGTWDGIKLFMGWN